MSIAGIPASPPADFDDFVARRRDGLLRAAQAMCRDPHTAEDLVQSALERTFVAWPRIRDFRAVDAYVRRAMVNQHIGTWRRSGRGAEHVTAEIPEQRDRAVEAGAGPAPDERAELWDLVCSLPPRQRAAVVLRFYEDMSEAETARVLGCSVGTVKSNTSRGLATLRARTRAGNSLVTA